MSSYIPTNLIRPGAGWTYPKSGFYETSLREGKWTNEDILIGFYINIKQFEGFDHDVLKIVRDQNLATAHDAIYKVDVLWALERLNEKFPWLMDPAAPMIWVYKALHGYLARRVGDAKRDPKLLDPNIAVVYQYVDPLKVGFRRR